MMYPQKFCFLVFLVCAFWADPLPGQTLIEEGDAALCDTDGVIEAAGSGAGYTGEGYLDYVSYAKWAIDVPAAGEYTLTWRYALGGGVLTSRDAEVIFNDLSVVDTLLLPHTGAWDNYAEVSLQVTLSEGNNEIRIRAFKTAYLPHIDHLKIEGLGVEAGECVDRFSLIVGINDENAGTIAYHPVQEYYESGTIVTLMATPNAGYFFQSWEGNDADVNATYELEITKNTELVARFLPEGTVQVQGVVGYATVQDDKGTPYLLTGGALGDTVAATSIGELKSYLEGDQPRVVTLDRHLVGTNSQFIKIGSHKTFVGITDSAHIQGVRTQIEDAKNIVIKNITFSKTITYDALQINSGSEQIWIDGCEFFSDRDHDKDYYDGLLDIKNASSYITVSNSIFHDHWKSILISSGDQELQDSVIRITFHDNYFYKNNSRLPLMRFGKAHMFNNYFYLNGNGINARWGACIRVENNLFELSTNSLINDDAAFQLIGNVGISNSQNDCELNPPYSYESLLVSDPNEIKDRWVEEEPEPTLGMEKAHLTIFPNPAQDYIHVHWPGSEPGLQVVILDLSGHRVRSCVLQKGGRMDVSDLRSGVYILRIETDGYQSIRFSKGL